MKRALLVAAVVALAPAIGWAQLLPPSPPIQSEPLPPPNMQAPPAQPGAGPVAPLPPLGGGAATGPVPPTDQAPAAPPWQGGAIPPPAPVPGVLQPPQAPGTTQPFPPSSETPTAPSSPGVPQSGESPQPSGQPPAPDEQPAPGQAPSAPGQDAGAVPVPPPPNVWVPQGGAIVQVLDKVNATIGTLRVKVGQSAAYGSLRIQVLACDIRPPDMPRDAAASLIITDTIPDQPGFKGWMLENEPFLSMLQSPSYDVRVEGCTP
jgi:hypothetical protein